MYESLLMGWSLLIHGYSTNSLLGYNCLNLTALDYLTELLRIYKPTGQLRSSSDTSTLCIPTVRTHSFGQRSFSYAAPAIWNTLPYKIRSSNTISSFKSSLKTCFSAVLLIVWGGGEREREWGRVGRERERTIGLSQSVKVCLVFFPLILFRVTGLVLQRRNGTEKNILLLLL